MPPTPSVRAVFRRPLQPGLHRRTRRRYTACVLLQRLQGDQTWPTLQVLPCQASPHLPAVQTPREGSTASARHGQGHPVLTSVIDAVVGTDEITEDMDTTQPASHAHVHTADAAAQCCIPQPERYLQFNPKHAPLTKHAEYLQDTDLVTLGVASPATVYKVELGYYGKEPTAAKKTLEHLNQRLPRIVATRTRSRQTEELLGH